MARTDSEWIEIEVLCTHCGRPLAVRPKETHYSLVIAGLYPLDVKHAGGGVTCARTYNAEPYSVWALEPAFRKARAAMDDEEKETRG